MKIKKNGILKNQVGNNTKEVPCTKAIQTGGERKTGTGFKPVPGQPVVTPKHQLNITIRIYLHRLHCQDIKQGILQALQVLRQTASIFDFLPCSELL